ncbi:MAG: rhodanese-like domain-containing protein [Deltaproteobacteria bacterium]|nr:rhodanese-like domain-containing protein [Deltaproteobacteria bacterium]
MMSFISGDEARKLISEGALLLDVRTPNEYAERHAPGAVNIPVQEIVQRVGECGPKERAIVVYCRSGQRSASALQFLNQVGYAKVFNLGSIDRW